MHRERLVAVAVAVLAVLALAVGAAVIDAPTRTAGTGGGSDGGSGGLFGEGSAFNLGQSSDPPTLGGGPPKILFQVLIAALIVGFLVALYLQRDEIGLRELKTVAVLAVVLAVVAVIAYYLLGLFDANPAARNGSSALGQSTPAAPGGGADGSADTALQPVATNLPVIALVVGAVLLVGLAVVFRSDDEDTSSESDSEPDETTRMTGVGRAAGRAADRITEEATVENEVYRAWHEMTTHLDMEHPESSTPREFARAASDAGMADEDVTELTDLFRTVRYGDSTVTTDRESRAVAALRRIEEAYAEEP